MGDGLGRVPGGSTEGVGLGELNFSYRSSTFSSPNVLGFCQIVPEPISVVLSLNLVEPLPNRCGTQPAPFLTRWELGPNPIVLSHSRWLLCSRCRTCASTSRIGAPSTLSQVGPAGSIGAPAGAGGIGAPWAR
jgi:hypothetical protein